MGHFPRKITMYICPECEQEYSDQDDADECCPREASDGVERWQCSICDDVYEDRDDAYNCCD
jgi:hypothetical protein